MHSIAVIAMAICIGTHFSESREVVMAWTVFLAIDFPLGWLILPIDVWLGPFVEANTSDFMRYVIMNAVGFFVLGGAQYFCIGKFIVFLLELLRKNWARC
ncbi:MAG: hypothetical protein JJU36_10180 [Phycisphaeraceae bacterium]|nr:hypothetical protein [Phycisphaeraceae bacterium]